MSQTVSDKHLRTITLEEHYASPAFIDGPGSTLKSQAPIPGADISHLLDRLLNLDQLRLSEMDAAGIDMQVLSLTTPGTEQLEAGEAVPFARDTNDYLAAAVRRHPERFAAFATLPTAAPEAAADELERTVQIYGFKGALINGHSHGRYLDDPHFWPILERAAHLQVPLYIHPTPPPQAVIDAFYTGHFSAEISDGLATSGWGWHIETAIHVLRIILGGVFDRYPDLQLIIGHLGEALPFMLSRLNLRFPQQLTKLQRPVSSYLRENVYYTISGFNFLPSFLTMLLEIGVERIMFSADYPFVSMEQAQTFLAQLPLSPADKARIAHVNAERVLHL
ncbi:amidohydrolase family protein [Dictyobacter aurantiacus]|uniref:Amidohydrolase n=1 Tax=Dictyobacter aurantiacus TaxID=1936993 RepID=A0A401Z9A2_9CHLR|nr:amidohydrolase family protein [Dictyobacter aurantiacus]GCE03444.1 amidohydrolase [Dictyobacter aurantiacus]